MAASDHLSKQLFHGTAHVFDENEQIEPRFNKVLKTETAFTTNSKELAEYYAGSAAARHGKLFGPIYEVEPVDPKESNADIPMRDTLRSLFKGPREYSAFGTADWQPSLVVSKKGFKPKKVVSWGINTSISGKEFPYNAQY